MLKTQALQYCLCWVILAKYFEITSECLRVIERHINSSEPFSLITAPLFLKIGSCRASRSARTDFFLLIFSLNRFFFRDCATFGFRQLQRFWNSCNFMTDSFYIYFSVDTKKDPKKFFGENGSLLYMLIRTSENVSMQSYYSNTSTSRKSLKGLSRCKIY